jgi:hypothetical protein
MGYLPIDHIFHSSTFLCLDDAASWVELQLMHDAESQPFVSIGLAFRSVGQPEILRVQYATDPGIIYLPSSIDTELWTHPEEGLRVVIDENAWNDLHREVVTENASPHAQVDQKLPEGLAAELMRLDLLQAHAADVDNEIKATQARIMKLWKADFEKCDGWKCYVKTAIAKAPHFAHLLATHWSHHNHIDMDFFRNQTHMNCSAEVQKVVSQHEQQVLATSVDNMDGSEDVAEDAHDEVADLSMDAEAASDVKANDDGPQRANHEHAPPPPSEPERPKWHHGPPGPGGRRPPWAKPGGRPPWANGDRPHGRPPWARPGGHSPWAPHENHTPGARPPSDRHGRPIRKIFDWATFTLTPQERFKIALAITLTALCGLSILLLACCLCLRRKIKWLRDPRRRAECAAICEERRTRRLYRKAAFKHRARTFFQRFRRPFASSDYEEKRAMLVHVDECEGDATLDGAVVRPEINRLRATHELVGEMMHPSSSSSSRPVAVAVVAELDTDRASLRSGNTLPPYSLPPPSYRAGLGSEFSVVDGFTGYTPSNTSATALTDGTPSESELDADLSTESSVVDCSPRLSFDSARTMTTGH